MYANIKGLIQFEKKYFSLVLQSAIFCVLCIHRDPCPPCIQGQFEINQLSRKSQSFGQYLDASTFSEFQFPSVVGIFFVMELPTRFCLLFLLQLFTDFLYLWLISPNQTILGQ